jgi:fructokinase
MIITQLEYMNQNKFNVVTFGEVLWDILPSGAVPGGAPMNVAYHLKQLGQHPTIITRIGNDEMGSSLKKYFSDLNVNTDYFQIDNQFETGKVFAKLMPDNEVSYDIVSPSAWDFITLEDNLNDLVSQSDYFIYGSLASRSAMSKKTLFQLLAIAPVKILDINLRKPHYDKQILEELLHQADILKLNESELEFITGWFSNYSGIEERVKVISERFGIEHIIVTLGGDGAYMYMNNQSWRHKGYKVEVEDTIGSGDAFLAGVINQLIKKAMPNEMLDFACKIGAFVATQKGACTQINLELLIKNQESRP